MALFLKGEESFDFAYSLYTDMVYRICVHNTACKSDAEDLTQEVFIKLLTYKKYFFDSEHLKAWLIRTTLNLCYDYSKKENNRKSAENCYSESISQNEHLNVIDYVYKLPVNHRNALYLHYYEGYTAKEIARLLKTKENTVLSWLKRGREELKELIGDDFNE